MRRILPCLLLLSAATPATGSDSNMRMRCDKAQRALAEVQLKLSDRNPLYAGDLQREQRLWEKQIRDNCRPARQR